jgi:hypothetical protein
VSGAHEVARTLSEQVFYPAHDARTESPEYAKVHHRLAVVRDLPCLICGVRNSTLKDPAQNRHGSKAMETHHHIVEWALQNAIDLGKFNAHVWPNLKARHPGKYDAPFTQQSMLDFIDHSEDNLWVLCDVHHRHSLVGIHAITAPIWGAQNLVRDDFTYIPQEK